jgi:hypothetical protein
MNSFDHALFITAQLVTTVADLETSCAIAFQRPLIASARLQTAIQETWLRLITDAQESKVSPTVSYVAALYEQLSSAALVEHPRDFVDRKDFPWEEYYQAGCGDGATCEDAWVVAELFWGGYVSHLQLSLGWLLLNGIRIQQGMFAITPHPNSTDQFINCLRWSGPDLFDAESLRALFYEYERRIVA